MLPIRRPLGSSLTYFSIASVYMAVKCQELCIQYQSPRKEFHTMGATFYFQCPSPKLNNKKLHYLPQFTTPQGYVPSLYVMPSIHSQFVKYYYIFISKQQIWQRKLRKTAEIWHPWHPSLREDPAESCYVSSFGDKSLMAKNENVLLKLPLSCFSFY